MKKEPLQKGSFLCAKKKEKAMWLFVGLGNPGKEYDANRHNIGFMAIDAVAQNYPALSVFKSKFQGKIAEGRIANEKVILLKPETYMNKSGQSVAKAMQFYKVPAERVVVFHDELDIPASDLRVKKGGGNAGHNGLKSIQSLIGTGDFWRVRIGIGRPAHKSAVSNYVLSDFDKSESDWVERLVDLIGDNVDAIIKDDPMTYASLIKDKMK